MSVSSAWPQSNTLYFGDNLDVLREHVPSESVDLIYLDPPFNSKRDYNLLFQRHAPDEYDAQFRAFKDSWTWDQVSVKTYAELTDSGAEKRGVPDGLIRLLESIRWYLDETDMMAYIVMMAIRLVELRRILKTSGSLYLHCDPCSSHYLKMLLDAILGPSRFLNEIIWKRTTAHNSAKRYAPIHDTILYYGRTDKVVWNSLRLPYAEKYLDKYYRFDDGDGRLYWRDKLCATGVRKGRSGVPWRGIDPAAKGMHWAYTVEKLDELDAEGRIYWPPGGTMPQYKRYRDELKGKAIPDIWDDIDRINPVGSERIGYPTQKPLSLLKRIIMASSNKGDVVLDPFCGCGTAVHASQMLSRRWIGIDISHFAIGIIRKRLNEHFKNIKYNVTGEPADAQTALMLAQSNPYQFQWWALDRVGAHPVGDHTGKIGKKGKDRGIDGVIRFRDSDSSGPSQRVIVSVKAGKNLSPSMVRDLRGTIEREGAPLGILLSMYPPTKEMRVEAAKAGTWRSQTWDREYHRIQLLTIADIFKGKRIEYPGRDVTNSSSSPIPPMAEAEEEKKRPLQAARAKSSPPPKRPPRKRLSTAK